MNNRLLSRPVVAVDFFSQSKGGQVFRHGRPGVRGDPGRRTWKTTGMKIRRSLALLAGIFLSLPMLYAATERRINTWLVCGTFPSGNAQAFEADPIGEADVRPAVGKVSTGKRWLGMDDRLYCRNLDDYVDLYTFFSPSRNGSPAQLVRHVFAYAHVYIWSPRLQDVEFLVGARDGYRAWLNGHRVRDAFALRQWTPRDGDAIAAHLEQGWNRLLFKIQSDEGVFGFSCKVADEHHRPIDGLEYSIDAPEGDLRITTAELPAGYAGWPYVWLECAGSPDPARAPSASPFRLSAAGGQPPYRWRIAPTTQLPSGLFLAGDEGELLGVCTSEAGRHSFRVMVNDAQGAQVARTLAIEVNDRPTRWFEDAKLGGLINNAKGYAQRHGDPVEQARLLSAEGYAWAAPSTNWSITEAAWNLYTRLDGSEPAEPQVRFTEHEDVGALARAFRTHGIRFGAYVGFFDNIKPAFRFLRLDDKGKLTETLDAGNWPLYQSAVQQHLERMCLEYQPAVLFLDNLKWGKRNGLYWDLDALYSLIKTMAPECIVLANSDTDYDVGDADAISVEGNNDAEPYWSRWPRGRSGFNPKQVAIEAWRFPFAWANWQGTERARSRKPTDPDAFQDPEEWLRVLVSLVGEGFECDMDHSFGFGREAMHHRMAEWLGPRVLAIEKTHPGPLAEADWGYNVARENTVYLYLLSNSRGKVGLNGRAALTVGPLDRRVRSVRLVPGNASLKFEKNGTSVRIEFQGVHPDPVSTIVALDLD
jgi:hypothetical protein